MQLNLPAINLKLKTENNSRFLFDTFRKKWVVFTPEEYVRQHIAHYLVQQKKIPASYIAIERQITINGLVKRFDLLVYNKNLIATILVECKAPEIEINQNTLMQIANYNEAFNVNYLFVSNGLTHFVLGLNQNKFEFKAELPDWKEMNK